jgi:ADP-ribose pyrophosphatase
VTAEARWERLAREVVSEGRVVDVYKDAVRIERDGRVRESTFDVVHHPGAVAIVALYADGTVALLDQFRYAVGKRLREIPAGTLEEEESFEACAVRELAEETGCRAERWTELATFYTTPGFCDETMRLFLAEDLADAEGAPDEDEHLELVRVPLADAVAAAERGELGDAKTIAGLLLARARLTREGRWPA